MIRSNRKSNIDASFEALKILFFYYFNLFFSLFIYFPLFFRSKEVLHSATHYSETNHGTHSSRARSTRQSGPYFMWTPTAIVSKAENSGAAARDEWVSRIEPPLVHHWATCEAYANASGSGCEPPATARTTATSTSGPRRERRAGAATVQKRGGETRRHTRLRKLPQ